MNKYGADIVRLWASSVEFTNEVPFSEESFALLADAYRRAGNLDGAWNLYNRLSNSERTAIKESAKTGLVYVSSDRAKVKK